MALLSLAPPTHLPRGAVDMVNLGVWSCYKLRDHKATYLLVTNTGGTFYYLNNYGEVLNTAHDARFEPPLTEQMTDVVRFDGGQNT